MPSLLEYDAFVSGMSMSPNLQGYDAAASSVPVANGSPAAVAATPESAGTPMPTNGKPLTHNGLLGQPAHWWLILVGFWFGLNWLAKRYNVPRFTLLQSVILVLQYVVVIVALKVVLTRWTIPGLSPIVISA